jgi:hypothetical protein
METDEERIDEVERRIFRLYEYDVNMEEEVNSIRVYNVIPEFVRSIYNKLSAKVEKMTERFHYYTIKRHLRNHFSGFYCWTSRYLLAYSTCSSNTVFHKITIFDLFHDRSM